ncbi:IS701 family transposase [Longimicrobium sp.]|uniref:IS701 family transposase n=1 Tax=Longimicrobium sp. TaxID=2029185 RepID=UPI002E311E7F|nr:transposase [Longimicrobium sp.]HEX6038552.1 transposase [Longimicrobium sp.]
MCLTPTAAAAGWSEFEALLLSFAPLFTQPTFGNARQLVIGALLSPGRRTVTAALRISGLEAKHTFVNYHRVLSRARWSPLQASHILLLLLLIAFALRGPIVIGLDETIERRWGKKIDKRGIYRDPVRSSRGHFVKASGLRWICVMLLVRVPFAGRVWALPFLTALAPSERYAQQRGIRHKAITDWGRQLVKQVRRWVAERKIILVCDSTYAAYEFLAGLRRHVIVITQMRLDSGLYAPAPEPAAGKRGRKRLKGERLPSLRERLHDPTTVWRRIRLRTWYGRTEKTVEITTFTAVWYYKGKPPISGRFVLVRDPDGKLESRAYLCTDPSLRATRILSYFVRRWQMEVTFAESRRHLGVETQRQWSHKAIDRTTPVLLGLFSIVTLLGQRLHRSGHLTPRQAAWYSKQALSFSDAIAAVRRQLWLHENISYSPYAGDNANNPDPLLQRWADALAYAA